jgi:hypothetical protein
MTNENSPLPPAGWHPDPAGSGRSRWWDGSVWTDHYSDAPVAPSVVAPVVPPVVPPVEAPPAYGERIPAVPVDAPAATAAPAYGTGSAYSTAPAYGSTANTGGGAVLKAPEGTNPITPWIWIIALLPIIDIISSFVYSSTVDVDALLDPSTAASAPLFTGTQLLQTGITYLVLALAVLFAILDWRALKRAGVPQPFHWAWIFFLIIGAPVYMIGRSVVARRRTGTGLAPMIVNLVLVLINFTVGVVFAASIFAEVLDSFSTLQ